VGNMNRLKKETKVMLPWLFIRPNKTIANNGYRCKSSMRTQ
jgi:hypothetical protein